MTEAPIRICFVCTHSFTLATLYKGLFPYLRSRGYDIEVVVGDREYSDFDPRYFGPLQPNIVPMRRTPAPFRDIVSLVRLYLFFRKGRFDLVHVSTPKAGLLGSMAARAARARAVVFVYRHCVYALMTGLRRRLYWQTDRITCAASDLVLANSRQSRDFLVEEGLARADKVRMNGSGSSNGVDVRRFHPDAVSGEALEALRASLDMAPGAPVLVFIGRLHREKGVDYLPELIARIRQRHPEAVLVVAGPEDERDRPSEETMTSFAEDPGIRRMGFVADPSPLYALADLFVFTSLFEGFPNVLLEAAAHARVAIGFDVPGVQEAIAHGESGILVPVGDVAAMAGEASRLLGDSEARRAMASRARRRVEEEFANEVVWAGLDSTFRRLIGRPAEAAE